uniref:Uncharacterized protein n=1 Tax=Arundo donax TaxID=35708 RepID=A0A0A9GVT1_ARUDO
MMLHIAYSFIASKDEFNISTRIGSKEQHI